MTLSTPVHMQLPRQTSSPLPSDANIPLGKSNPAVDKSLDSIENISTSDFLLNNSKGVTLNTMSTSVKTPILSKASSREAPPNNALPSSDTSASSQRPRGASAFNAPFSDMDLAASSVAESSFHDKSLSDGQPQGQQNKAYIYNSPASVLNRSSAGSESSAPTVPRRQGSLNRLMESQDSTAVRRPGISTEALRRGSAQQTAFIPTTDGHPLSPTVVDPHDSLSWESPSRSQSPVVPPPLTSSARSSKFSLISVDEITSAVFQSSPPSASLMESSLGDTMSLSHGGRGRRATAPADAIAHYRPKSPKGKQSGKTKSRESLASPSAWHEPTISPSVNGGGSNAGYPAFVASYIGPPPPPLLNNGATSASISQRLGASSSLSVNTSTTSGSGRERDRTRSHSPAREFVRNYLKTTTPSTTASTSSSVTPTNTSPSVQRLMAMTSTVAQTIRANVASAVSSTSAGTAPSGIAQAATTMFLGSSKGGSESSTSPKRKASVIQEANGLATSGPTPPLDGNLKVQKQASQPSLKQTFSTSTSSIDSNSTRLLSSVHLSETLTPNNQLAPLAARRLSCAVPKDQILPGDWPARTDQLAMNMDMLLQDTRAIVGEVRTSLEAAEQENLAVGVKLANARTKLRSLVAWEATSTQAVVGWLNMAVSRHRQIEREVKDWGSRPSSPHRSLLVGDDGQAKGLVDSGQNETQTQGTSQNDHFRMETEQKGEQAVTTAAFQLFDQTMTPSDFSLASKSSPANSLNGSANESVPTNS